MFASLFGKSKELEEANELDLPVSYVRLVASQAQADRHPRSAHLTSTSSIRPLLARVKCNMTLSTSTAFFEPVPTLTAVQHRSSTWTWRRRPEDMDGRQRKDVATRLSARRLEEWCCSVSCQSHDFWIRCECLQQGGLAAIVHFCRGPLVGSTRSQARTVGQSPTNHLHWTQPWGNSDQKGRTYASLYR
jgi:hypothetical protein